MAEVLWRLIEKSSGIPSRWASAIGEHSKDLTAHALICALDHGVRNDPRSKNGHVAQYAIRDSTDGETQILEEKDVWVFFGFEKRDIVAEHTTKPGKNCRRVLVSMGLP